MPQDQDPKLDNGEQKLNSGAPGASGHPSSPAAKGDAQQKAAKADEFDGALAQLRSDREDEEEEERFVEQDSRSVETHRPDDRIVVAAAGGALYEEAAGNSAREDLTLIGDDLAEDGDSGGDAEGRSGQRDDGADSVLLGERGSSLLTTAAPETVEAPSGRENPAGGPSDGIVKPQDVQSQASPTDSDDGDAGQDAAPTLEAAPLTDNEDQQDDESAEEEADDGAPEGPPVQDEDEAPTDLWMSETTLAENADGAVIGTLGVADADSTSHSYSVNDPRFEVVGTTLKLKDGVSLDYEAEGGSLSITVTVTDSGGNSYSEAFTLTLTDENDSGQVFTSGGSASASENVSDGVVIYTAAATDIDTTGEAITFSLVDNAGGLFEIDPNTGEVTLTDGLSLDFDTMASHDITIQSSDGVNTTNHTVTITVDDIAEAVTLADGGVVFNDDGVSEISITGGDGDDTINALDGDDLISGGAGDDAIDGGDGADIVQFSGNWADYTITENAGVYTVVHKNAGADGTDTVTNVETFRFADGDVAAADVLNDGPVANADAGSLAEDAVSVSGDVLANDTDADIAAGVADTLTVAEIGGEAGDVGSAVAGTYGSVTLNADGSYSYSLDNGNGAVQALNIGDSLTDTFTYTVTDEHGATSTATLTITIDGTNDGPVANADAASINEDAVSVSGDVLTNDTDADTGATLTVAEIGGEAGDVGSAVAGTYGSVTLNADGSYSYSLDNGNGAVQALNIGDSLTDSFTYTVTDEHGATSTATLTITIDGTNDGPVANADAASIAEDAVSVSGDVLTNDTDADTGATLTVAEIGGEAGDVGSAVAGSYGSVTLNADGSYSYSLDNGNGAVQALNIGDSLTDTFTYTVTDEHGATSTATLTITIDGTNDRPVANADAASIAEDAVSVSGDVLTNDTDADTGATLTVAEIGGEAGDVGSAVAGTYGSVTLNADGSYSYSLDNGDGAVQALNIGDSLTDSFTYTVTDEHGATSTATLTITIDGTNDGPVANADAASIAEDAVSVSGDVLTNDTDADTGATLTVAEIGGEAGDVGSAVAGSYGSVTLNADGSYSYSLDNGNGAVQALNIGDSLTDTFTYTVTDEHGATSTATLTITIDGTNDGPVANADAASIAEDAVSVSGDVLTNDTDADTGATLTVAEIGGEAGDVGSAVAGTYGSVTLNADGSYSYSLDNGNGAVQALNIGDSLTDTFTYTVTDEHGATSTATLTITIDGTNDGPVANADAASIAEDAVSVSGDVLTNDTDADTGATLTVAEIGGEAGDVGSAVAGSYGSVTLNADGSYSYSLDNGNGAVQALNIGDSLTDTFTYTVTDEHGATSTATLTITIDGTNDGPVANADAASINEDAVSVSGDVLTNDTDADTGATLTVAEIGGEAGDVGSAVAGTYGSVTLNADGSYSYSLDNGNGAVQALNIGDSLTDTFTYTVTDEHGATSTATLTITIDGTNDGPVANADAASINEDAVSVSGDVLTNDTDADTGATLTVAEIGGEAGDVGSAVAGTYGSVTLNADGSYSYSLDNGNGAVQALNIGDSLTDTFTYTVTDEHGATSTATLTITIDGTNDGPVANADAASIAEDAVSVSGDVLTNDTDADTGATLTVAEIGGEAGDVGSAVAGSYGSVTLNADGSYSYSLDNGNGAVQALNIGDSLTDTFTYTVTDEHGATSTATLTITIDGTNDGPVANADAASIAEDAVSVSGDVLTNDTDADTGATLTVAEIGGEAGDVGSAVAGSYGSVTLNADGSYSYSLDNGNGAVQALNIGDSLTDTFTYTVTDEHGATSTATLTITIDGTNDGPVANADAASINEDAVSVSGDVLTNDTDADTGATLTVAEIGGEAGDVGSAVTGTYGSVTLNADGSYSYSLDNGNGAVQALNVGDSLTDTFTYTVTDEHGATSTATLTITIDGTNDAPVIASDGGGATGAVSINENSAAVTTVTSTDVDTGATAVYSIAGGADAALFQIDPNTGALSFISAPSFEGASADADDVYEVTVQVTDDQGATDTQTLSVTVNDLAENISVSGTFVDSGVAETSITGSAGSDDITLHADGGDVDAGAGDDTIRGGAGDDTIDGGAGNDTAVFSGDYADYAVTYNAATDSFTLNGPDGTDWVTGVESFQFNDQTVGEAALQAAADQSIGGTGGDDTITGGSGDDVIDGGAGNDDIDAGDGDDTITGGAGDDTIDGGAGTDTAIFSGNYADYRVAYDGPTDTYTLTGPDGTDTVTGVENFQFDDQTVGETALRAAADQTIVGTAGADAITTGTGDDDITGGDGDDTITAGMGDDTIDGGAGTGDTAVFSGNLADYALAYDVNSQTFTLTGPDGTDTVTGVESFQFDDQTLSSTALAAIADQTYVGTAGGDSYTSGSGDDTLTGGAGDDTLEGGAGADIINAGDGDDTIIVDDNSDTIDGGDGYDYVNAVGAGEGVTIDTAASDVERVDGSNFADTIDGSSDSEALNLRGFGGDDVITGGSGDDNLEGDDGDDTLTGGAGDDTLEGGAGADIINAGDGDDTIIVEDNSDTIDGGAGYDYLRAVGASEGITVDTAASDVERVDGSNFADTIDGSSDSEALNLRGFDGDDVITGGSGDDNLEGDDGDDTLTGGAGDDTLEGGAGADIINAGDGDDTIIVEDDSDTIDGGAGYDYLRAIGASEGITIDTAASDVERVDGSNFADTIDGSSDSEALNLRGFDGDDIITGGSGDDNLEGDDGDDTLTGGAGDDTLEGGAGADILSGGDGDDTITGGSGDDTIDGGSGTDTADFSGDYADYAVSYDSATDTFTLTGPDGTDTVTGVENFSFDDQTVSSAVLQAAADQSIGGTAGDDTITGGTGDDVIDGGAGNDDIDGGDGDDTITGGAGDDTIDGGAGTDTAVFSGNYADYQVDYNVNTQTYTLTGPDGTDTVTNVENFQFDDQTVGEAALRAAADQTFTGAGSPDNYTSGSGDDTLSGEDGNDTLTAGAGDDVITGGGGSDTLDGGDGADTLDGGSGNDDLSGGAGGDTITGGSGLDTITGGAGDDTIDGGSESDTAVFSGNYADYTVSYDGATDTFTLTGPDGTDTVTNVESFKFDDQTVSEAALQAAADQTLGGTGGDDTITGGTGDDVIDGGAGNDDIDGGDGDDTITGGAGDDAIDGGAGTDTAIFSGNYADYTVAYDGPTDTYTLTGPDGTDTVTGVENFQFDDQTVGEAALRAAADQTIVGTAGADAITTGTGDDDITGGDGDDTITAGTGDDAIDGGAGTGDTAIFSGNYADYTVSYDGATDTFTLTGPDGTDTVTNVESFQFDDQTVSEAALQAAADQTLGGTGGDDTITGGTGDDVIDGGAGNDDIDGGDGDDTITGGAGDDAIDGGAGTDTAIFSGNYADYTVAYDGPTDTYTLTGPDGTDTVTGVENFQFDDQTVGEAALRAAADQTIVGTAGVDAITTGTGDDDITGGDGDDTITGGTGDDVIDGGAGTGDTAIFSGNYADYTVSYDGATDTFTLTGPDGTDTVTGVENFQFDDQTVDNATLQAGADQTLGGTGGDDTITGGTGDDVIDGGAGADDIDGGDGDDTITGGAGDDTIDGGTGTDTAIFSGNYADYTIAYDVNSDTYTLTGPDGTDTVTGVENFQFDDQTVGEAALRAGADQTYTGTSGDDSYTAGTGDDTLTGGDGADTLNGGDGADTITGGAGDDTIDGGDGTDTAVFSGNALDYEISVSGGTITVVHHATGDTDTLTNVETLQFDDRSVTSSDLTMLTSGVDWQTLTAGADWVNADGDDDVIDAGAGDDWVMGGAGDDTIEGGAGDDILDGGAGNDIAWFDGVIQDHSFSIDADGRLVITDENAADGDDGTATLENFEAVSFNGTSYDITSLIDGADGYETGTSGSDFMVAAAGGGTIIGNEGSDVLAGGSGNDSLQGESSSGDAGTDIFLAGAGDDTIYMGDGGDTVYAGTGDDTIRTRTYSLYDAVVDGGDGTDVLVNNQAGGYGSINAMHLNAGTTITAIETIDVNNFDLMFDGAGTFDLSSVTAVNNAILVLGDADAQDIDLSNNTTGLTFQLGGGDDRLQAGSGDDTIDGGTGNDTVVFTGDLSDYSFAISGSSIVVTDSVGGRDGADTLSDIEQLEFNDGTISLQAGTTGADTLTGGAGADLLVGGTGTDTIDGGDGTDTAVFSGDYADYTVSYSVNIDTFTLTGPDGTNYVTNVENFQFDDQTVTEAALREAADQTYIGTTGDDSYTSGTGDDTLNGGAGDDTLTAGDGDDTLYGDGSTNYIINGSFEDVAGGFDTGDFVEDTSVSGWTEASGQTFEMHDSGYHGMSATDGSYWLDMGEGDARLDISQSVTGLNSGESYQLSFDVGDRTDNGSTLDVYFGGELIATIDPTTEDVMESHVFDVVAGSGDGSDTLRFVGQGGSVNQGVSLDNVQLVAAGDDTLSGGAGDDTIYGGGGADIIDGGAGADTIDSGDGALQGSGAASTTSTTFNLIHLGSAADVDTNEGDTTSENAGDLLGSYGGGNTPLYNNIVRATTFDTDSDGTLDDNDAGAGSETIRIDGVDGVMDSFQTYFATVTFTDGTTANISARIMQMTDGELYFAPEWTSNSTTDLFESKAIESISLDSLDNNNVNMYATRFDTDYQTVQGDTVDGGAGDDVITGGDGGDTFTGGAGSDTIDGGDGADTAIFTGNFADYTITESSGTFTVVDNRSGSPDGTDTITNIESLQFADQTVAIEDAVPNSAPTDATLSGDASLTPSAAGNAQVSGYIRSVGFDTSVDHWSFTHEGGSLQINISDWGDAEMKLFRDNGDGTFTYLNTTEFNFSFGSLTAGEYMLAVGEDTLDTSEALDTGDSYPNSSNGGGSYSITFVGDTVVSGLTENPASPGNSWGDPQNDAVLISSGGEALADNTVVATVDAVDANSGDTHTYTLTDDAGGLYDIDSSTGEISVDGGGSAVQLSTLGTDTVTVEINDGEDTYDETIELMFGGSDADTLNGASLDSVIYDFGGDDTINGGAGDDVMMGGDGSDTFIIEIGDGNDTIVGGAGGAWSDEIQLDGFDESGASGTVGGTTFAVADWTVTLESGTIDGINANSIDFSNDADGTITFDNGDTINFDEIETLSWT